MRITGLGIASLFLLLSLGASAASKPRSSAPASEPAATNCIVQVDAQQSKGRISPQLMGFNVVFQNEPDSFWADGKIEQRLKELKCGVLRWPGGEVSSYYHWDKMINKGETDTWTPGHENEPSDPARFMDLEEYMKHVRAIGCEPMVGVNMMSGERNNRRADGLAEAKALIQHCVDEQYNVKYWFLDNECYLPEKKPELTPEQYAECINAYAEVLKSVDPSIEIIANWMWCWSPEWEKILQIAGKNIDIADMHFYWRSAGVSYDFWLQQTPMGQGRSIAENHGKLIKIHNYMQTIQDVKDGGNALGLKIKTASLEWNVGPSPKAPLSQFQAALMQAEEFGEFINGGMDLACLWPMHWPDSNAYRTVFDDKTGAPHPNYQMLKMYSDAMGQNLLASSTTAKEVRSVAAQTPDGNTVYLYLLRKSNDAPDLPTTLNLKGFEARTVKAVCFNSADINADQAEVKEIPVNVESINLPAHSFTKITLSK